LLDSFGKFASLSGSFYSQVAHQQQDAYYDSRVQDNNFRLGRPVPAEENPLSDYGQEKGDPIGHCGMRVPSGREYRDNKENREADLMPGCDIDDQNECRNDNVRDGIGKQQRSGGRFEVSHRRSQEVTSRKVRCLDIRLFHLHCERVGFALCASRANTARRVLLSHYTSIMDEQF